ncbi:EAL domain-containing protein [Bosea sp. LjRoot9]|uniref:putative bifunctional diguanylate cyclase/phosphodiesterase n=1 Tax=Bosea sp. LjRoot9 TaxID=3342341 RepID=UPI003ECFA7E1
MRDHPLPEPEPARSAAWRESGTVTTRRDDETAGLLERVERLQRELEETSRLLRERDEALAHSKKIFDRASEAAKIGVWECDLTNADSLRWTDAVYDLFELPRGSKLDRFRIVEMYDPGSRAAMETLRSKAIRERGGFTLDAKITTALGNERWMRLTADVESENGVAVRIFGMKQDITEERALWDQTRFLAEIDLMTGLANRGQFQAILSGQSGEPVGPLLLVDLDGFKQVNDTFGHGLGDECLKQVAARLRCVCAEARLVARIGGDEFAVLMGAASDRSAAEALTERILDALRCPIAWGAHVFQLGASVGIAIPQGFDAASAAELFSHADIALYAAKAAGKNTFRAFDPQMKSEGERRFETVRDIGRALIENQLELYYQPKLRLSDQSLSGFEALLRRRMPDGRVVAAGAFQAALNDPDLSARLGKWVVEKALRQAGLWHRAGFDFGSLAINLSASQLHDHHFAETLIERVAEQGLRPGMIEIEVTEGVFLDDESGPVKRILERLKQCGMRVALDDFGTGYASLVHLRSYPIDVIKVDKSFVQRFLSSAQDRAILETILRLGASLGMDIVAEGIETAAQLQALKALGCPFGQGFLFSPAVPASRAVDWLLPVGCRQNRVA